MAASEENATSSAGAIDLVTKVVGVLAAILGTAGYVLVLGAAILWVRLHQVNLPPEVPVSLAGHDELIAIGAQAVAVWVLLVAALGGLSAWIVTGDPERRPFSYVEAGLALAVTVSLLLALNSNSHWLAILPGFAAILVALGALYFWPSGEEVVALLLPIGVGSGLAVALSYLSNGNGIATSAGATCIFAVLVLLAPSLQKWRAGQEINQKALNHIKVQKDRAGESGRQVDALIAALEQGGGRPRSPAVVWIGRVAIGLLALIALGCVAVASQVDRGNDFHKALVSLANDECLEGTYIARGNEQIVIAQPGGDGSDEHARVTAIPIKEVLEVQVYSESLKGVELTRDKNCAGNGDVLVRPPKPDNNGGNTSKE